MPPIPVLTRTSRTGFCLPPLFLPIFLSRRNAPGAPSRFQGGAGAKTHALQADSPGGGERREDKEREGGSVPTGWGR